MAKSTVGFSEDAEEEEPKEEKKKKKSSWKFWSSSSSKKKKKKESSSDEHDSDASLASAMTGATHMFDEEQQRAERHSTPPTIQISAPSDLDDTVSFTKSKAGASEPDESKKKKKKSWKFWKGGKSKSDKSGEPGDDETAHGTDENAPASPPRNGVFDEIVTPARAMEEFRADTRAHILAALQSIEVRFAEKRSKMVKEFAPDDVADAEWEGRSNRTWFGFRSSRKSTMAAPHTPEHPSEEQLSSEADGRDPKKKKKSWARKLGWRDSNRSDKEKAPVSPGTPRSPRTARDPRSQPDSKLRRSYSEDRASGTVGLQALRLEAQHALHHSSGSLVSDAAESRIRRDFPSEGVEVPDEALPYESPAAIHVHESGRRTSQLSVFDLDGPAPKVREDVEKFSTLSEGEHETPLSPEGAETPPGASLLKGTVEDTWGSTPESDFDESPASNRRGRSGASPRQALEMPPNPSLRRDSRDSGDEEGSRSSQLQSAETRSPRFGYSTTSSFAELEELMALPASAGSRNRGMSSPASAPEEEHHLSEIAEARKEIAALAADFARSPGRTDSARHETAHWGDDASPPQEVPDIRVQVLPASPRPSETTPQHYDATAPPPQIVVQGTPNDTPSRWEDYATSLSTDCPFATALAGLLSEHSLTSYLEPQQRTRLISGAQRYQVEEEQPIYKKGDDVDALLVIEEGELSVMDVEAGEQVESLGSGSIPLVMEFGCDLPASGGVITSQPSILWRVGRDAYREGVRTFRDAVDPQLSEMLKSVSVLRGLSPEERDAVAAAMEIERFPPGTIIFTQKTMGRRMYLVLDGICEGLRSPEMARRLYNCGEAVGHLCLMRPQPHKETLSAGPQAGVTLASLSRQTFQNVVGEDAHAVFERGAALQADRPPIDRTGTAPALTSSPDEEQAALEDEAVKDAMRHPRKKGYSSKVARLFKGKKTVHPPAAEERGRRRSLGAIPTAEVTKSAGAHMV